MWTHELRKENHGMKRLWIALAIALMVTVVPAMAQNNAKTGPLPGETATVPPEATPLTPTPEPEAWFGNPANGHAMTPNIAVSPGQMPPTPEMWFYEQQLREYLDPGMAVRRNAEFRANQRRGRMAARKWFGFSNSRPTASPDPYNGEYSPSWDGNNNLYPSRWSGYGRSTVVLRPVLGTY